MSKKSSTKPKVPKIDISERKPTGKRMPFKPKGLHSSKSEKFSGHKHSRFEI